MKTVDGALPVFEMRRDSDADFEEGVGRGSDATDEDARRESETRDDVPALEEPDEDDEYDDVGTAEPEESKSRLPPSLAATPPPALPGTAAMIAIKHKSSRAMKRAESEIVVSTSPSEDLDSSAVDDGGLKKRRKKGASNTGEIATSPISGTATTRRSSSSKRSSKRDSGPIGAGVPLPPELPSADGENGNGDLPSPLSAPLPPPLPAEGPVSPSKKRNGLPSPLPSSRSSEAIVPTRGDQGSTEEDEEPPPMLSAGVAGMTDEIANISFTRRTSLAMEGFSTLRESLDGSEGSNSATGSPGEGRRGGKTLRRRQSSKSGSSGAIRKVRMTPTGAGTDGASVNGSGAGATPPRRSVAQNRPRMMDGILRIVKSMYEADTRATMDSRIFAIEAKEYPENVVYIEEDDEGTEDYSVEFPAIKAATVEKLILGLTPEAYTDPDFTFAFLLTFHSFMTPQKLTELLKCRWSIPKPQKPSKTGVTVDDEHFSKKKLTPIRLRIINVIKLWLDEHRKSLDSDARSAIEKFIEETIKPDMAGAAGTLLRVLKESTEVKDEQMMFDEKPPKPYLPMNVKTKLSLLDIHPEEIARQITLIDSALYRKIKPGEFLHSGWTKSDKDARSPGILAMINSFNVVSRWISTQILMQQDLKQRAIMLNRVICIAQHCYEYNNFNGVMEIVASLHNSSIHRLYNTWDMLPQKSWDMFENLSLIMNSNAGEGNFFLYRNALRKIIPPLVPYLGVYLTDLIFLNDGNKDFADDAKKMVNFHKMAKIARVVRTITIHQQTPYCLTPVEFIQDFILKGPLLTDDEQYVESCKLEKKVPKAQRAAQQASNKGVKKIKVDFKALNITDD